MRKARAYSLDLRERVMATCDRGESAAAAAERNAASKSFIKKLKWWHQGPMRGPHANAVAA